VGVLFLYLEIFKSTNTGIGTVLDHALSMVVFVIFLVEFLVVDDCGTSTFFILGLMSLLDVVAGFTVSIAGARRDFTYGGQN
jgi:NADH:ubiquinone oxidoreductase subunit F (NADH-binding)